MSLRNNSKLLFPVPSKVKVIFFLVKITQNAQIECLAEKCLAIKYDRFNMFNRF